MDGGHVPFPQVLCTRRSRSPEASHRWRKPLLMGEGRGHPELLLDPNLPSVIERPKDGFCIPPKWWNQRELMQNQQYATQCWLSPKKDGRWIGYPLSVCASSDIRMLPAGKNDACLQWWGDWVSPRLGDKVRLLGNPNAEIPAIAHLPTPPREVLSAALLWMLGVKPCPVHWGG